MRLIDADALLNSTDKECVHAWEVALAPTIEVESVRHGHWIVNRYITTAGSFTGHAIVQDCKCSVCGALFGNLSDRFCYNCGAKMDKKKEGV